MVVADEYRESIFCFTSFFGICSVVEPVTGVPEEVMGGVWKSREKMSFSGSAGLCGSAGATDGGTIA